MSALCQGCRERARSELELAAKGCCEAGGSGTEEQGAGGSEKCCKQRALVGTTRGTQPTEEHKIRYQVFKALVELSSSPGRRNAGLRRGDGDYLYICSLRIIAGYRITFLQQFSLTLLIAISSQHPSSCRFYWQIDRDGQKEGDEQTLNVTRKWSRQHKTAWEEQGIPKPLGMNPQALQHHSGSQGDGERSFPFGRRGGFPIQGHKRPRREGNWCLLLRHLSPRGNQLPSKNLRSFLQTLKTHHIARSSPIT